MDIYNKYFMSIKRIILYFALCVFIFTYRNIFEDYFTYKCFISDNICYCTFVFVLAIIISELKKIDQQYCDKLIEEFFLPVSLSCVASLYHVCFYNVNSQMIYFYINNELIMFLEIMLFYNIINNESEFNRIQKRIVYLVIVSSFILSFSDDEFYIHVYITILHIVDFVMIVNFCKKAAQVKLFNKKTVNILKIFEYCIVPYYWLLASVYMFNDKNLYAQIIKHNFIVYIFFMILAVNQVTDFPYKKIFSNMKKENQYLNTLNKNVRFNNILLERSNTEYKKNQMIYYSLFKNMPYSIMIINESNNRIIYINDELCNMFNIKNKKEIINSKTDRYIKFINVSLDRKSYNSVINFNNIKKYVNVTILNEYKILYGKVYLIKDISEKVKIKKVKKEIQNRKKQEILHIKFLDGIGNNIKMPVTILNSTAQIIKVYAKNHNMYMVKKYNNIIYNKCINIQIVSNNLIDNSKIKYGNLNINDIKYNIVEKIKELSSPISDYVTNEGYNLILKNLDYACILFIDSDIVKKILFNMIYIVLLNSEAKENENNIYISVNDYYSKLDIEITSDNFTIKQNDNGSLSDDNSEFYFYVNKYLAKTQNILIHLDKKNETSSIHLLFLKGERHE